MANKKVTYFVTGAAGFIGFHTSLSLIKSGQNVIGLDNLNDYYDPDLKKARLEILSDHERKAFRFYKGDLLEDNLIKEIFEKHRPNIVINLAAQAGVQYSLENPKTYIDSNITGFLNLIEQSRLNEVEHFIYASTSSVYGASKDMPFLEDSLTDHPIQFYAVTKKTNELTAHAYSSLYGLPSTGVRFFTVYGPWGRPDMALFKFTENILNSRPIDVNNNGNHSRSFTYVDDLVEAILNIAVDPATSDRLWSASSPKSSSSSSPYRIFNIGNPESVGLMKMIAEVERNLGLKAQINYRPLQKGDIESTKASNKKLVDFYGETKYTSIENGIKNFIEWYKRYHKVK